MNTVNIEVGVECGVGFVEVKVYFQKRTETGGNYGLEKGGAAVLGARNSLRLADNKMIEEDGKEAKLCSKACKQMFSKRNENLVGLHAK